MDKLKQLIRCMNERGIPIPTLRDPKNGLPSVTLTMMVISFNLIILGIIGKWSKDLNVDMSQAMTLFLTTAGLYLGRKMTGNDKKVELQDNITNAETQQKES